MVRLRTLGPTVAPADTRIARVPPKEVDGFYNSPEWKALRQACLRRAGFRCELAGPGCTGTAMIADHIKSRRQGGADDLSNLRALCRACDNRLKEDHLGRRRGGAAG